MKNSSIDEIYDFFRNQNKFVIMFPNKSNNKSATIYLGNNAHRY